MNIPRILPAHRQVSTRKEIQWTRSITPQLTVTQIYTCIQVHLHTNMIHEQLFQDEKKKNNTKMNLYQHTFNLRNTHTHKYTHTHTHTQ